MGASQAADGRKRLAPQEALSAVTDVAVWLLWRRHGGRHFSSGDTVRDIVIGMSDGLTVPFALAAGLSGAPLSPRRLWLRQVSREIAAGSIAMGLGGYLASRSDAEHYDGEAAPRATEVRNIPVAVANVLASYGRQRGGRGPVVRALKARPRRVSTRVWGGLGPRVA